MSVGRTALALLSLAFTLALAAPVAAQRIPVRFEVAGVGDSTVTFAIGDERWVRPGHEGIVVDPTRRDALVASLRVLTVTATEATCVVTGQTTRIAPGNVVIVQRRFRPWYARKEFWGGMVLGAVAGAIVGAQ